MTLKEIFAEIGHFGDDIGCNDKGGIHSYIDSYDELFEPFKDGCSILEIGLAMGDSIMLWDRYFSNSVITGVDLNIKIPSDNIQGKLVGKNNVIQLIEGDATKEDIIEKIDESGFDIVIDDGSHMVQDQVSTFELLKGRMNTGGIYIIEDILSLEQSMGTFKSLYENWEIRDFRSIKGRFDDVLIIYRF